MRNLRRELPTVAGIIVLVSGPTSILSPFCESSEPREWAGQRSFEQRGPTTESETLQTRMHRLKANMDIVDVAELFSIDMANGFEGGIQQVRAQVTRTTTRWKVGQTHHLTVVFVEFHGQLRFEHSDLKKGQRIVASWRASK